ncbi:MAG: hypothetical protein M1831_002410 [Alyxoria varia]|nr:MAG: hypothetical protein M1831_002410 [Alyxoria varia]
MAGAGKAAARRQARDTQRPEEHQNSSSSTRQNHNNTPNEPGQYKHKKHVPKSERGPSPYETGSATNVSTLEFGETRYANWMRSYDCPVREAGVGTVPRSYGGQLPSPTSSATSSRAASSRRARVPEGLSFAPALEEQMVEVRVNSGESTPVFGIFRSQESRELDQAQVNEDINKLMEEAMAREAKKEAAAAAKEKSNAALDAATEDEPSTAASHQDKGKGKAVALPKQQVAADAGASQAQKKSREPKVVLPPTPPLSEGSSSETSGISAPVNSPVTPPMSGSASPPALEMGESSTAPVASHKPQGKVHDEVESPPPSSSNSVVEEATGAGASNAIPVRLPKEVRTETGAESDRPRRRKGKEVAPPSNSEEPADGEEGPSGLPRGQGSSGTSGAAAASNNGSGATLNRRNKGWQGAQANNGSDRRANAHQAPRPNNRNNSSTNTSSQQSSRNRSTAPHQRRDNPNNWLQQFQRENGYTAASRDGQNNAGGQQQARRGNGSTQSHGRDGTGNGPAQRPNGGNNQTSAGSARPHQQGNGNRDGLAQHATDFGPQNGARYTRSHQDRGNHNAPANGPQAPSASNGIAPQHPVPQRTYAAAANNANTSSNATHAAAANNVNGPSNATHAAVANHASSPSNVGTQDANSWHLPCNFDPEWVNDHQDSITPINPSSTTNDDDKWYLPDPVERPWDWRLKNQDLQPETAPAQPFRIQFTRNNFGANGLNRIQIGSDERAARDAQRPLRQPQYNSVFPPSQSNYHSRKNQNGGYGPGIQDPTRPLPGPSAAVIRSIPKPATPFPRVKPLKRFHLLQKMHVDIRTQILSECSINRVPPGPKFLPTLWFPLGFPNTGTKMTTVSAPPLDSYYIRVTVNFGFLGEAETKKGINPITCNYPTPDAIFRAFDVNWPPPKESEVDEDTGHREILETYGVKGGNNAYWRAEVEKMYYRNNVFWVSLETLPSDLTKWPESCMNRDVVFANVQWLVLANCGEPQNFRYAAKILRHFTNLKGVVFDLRLNGELETGNYVDDAGRVDLKPGVEPPGHGKANAHLFPQVQRKHGWWTKEPVDYEQEILEQVGDDTEARYKLLYDSRGKYRMQFRRNLLDPQKMWKSLWATRDAPDTIVAALEEAGVCVGTSEEDLQHQGCQEECAAKDKEKYLVEVNQQRKARILEKVQRKAELQGIDTTSSAGSSRLQHMQEQALRADTHPSNDPEKKAEAEALARADKEQRAKRHGHIQPHTVLIGSHSQRYLSRLLDDMPAPCRLLDCTIRAGADHWLKVGEIRRFYVPWGQKQFKEETERKGVEPVGCLGRRQLTGGIYGGVNVGEMGQ